MNKKGFTTVELILTMAIVSVLMITITSVTYVYQERTIYERNRNELIDYKNTVTKIIYDDILNIDGSSSPVIKLEKISEREYHFIKPNETYYTLEIIDRENGEVGIKYGDGDEGVEYLVPGYKQKVVYISQIEMYPTTNTDSSVYKLDIIFNHTGLNQQIKIHIIFSI